VITVVIVLPDGFPDLVAVIIEDWNWDQLPKTNSDIWNSLLYPIFLGENIRSAQAGYAEKVLAPHLTMGAAQRAQSDPNWSKAVLSVINAELNVIRGTPGEGFKRAVLENVRESITELARTLSTALQFFKTHNVSVQKIRQIRNSRDETITLVDYAAREIYNVGYTKAVLWLYDCGIADDLAPPNSQNQRFLAECGYSGFGWSRHGVAETWQIFAPLCQRMREVADIVSRELKKQITAKQAQLAAWYLESCRGLPGMTRHGRQLTPTVLISFLESRSWSIDDLAKKLGDIERLEELGEELRDFVTP